MIIRTLFFALTLSVVVGCDDTARTTDSGSRQMDETIRSQSNEKLTENLDSYFRYGQFPPNCEVTETGSLACDGDVLPNPHVPPDGWEPLEFDGRTYYFVPLAKAGGQDK